MISRLSSSTKGLFTSEALDYPDNLSLFFNLLTLLNSTQLSGFGISQSQLQWGIVKPSQSIQPQAKLTDVLKQLHLPDCLSQLLTTLFLKLYLAQLHKEMVQVKKNRWLSRVGNQW